MKSIEFNLTSTYIIMCLYIMKQNIKESPSQVKQTTYLVPFL